MQSSRGRGATCVGAMNRLQATKDQILINVRQSRQKGAHDRRTATTIGIVDSLVGDLEELHLIGRKRVPREYESRLRDLAAILPPEIRRDLRSGTTINNLMDVLFGIQEGLLDRRSTFRRSGLDGGARDAHPLLLAGLGAK